VLLSLFYIFNIQYLRHLSHSLMRDFPVLVLFPQIYETLYFDIFLTFSWICAVSETCSACAVAFSRHPCRVLYLPTEFLTAVCVSTAELLTNNLRCVKSSFCSVMMSRQKCSSSTLYLLLPKPFPKRPRPAYIRIFT